ncbi:MAG TPA: ABC transporter substrate-binding protein [Chloroflexota bacterium]|nr:ABC transporter substrate-binding protein [Chloroflexota bacterium]
MLASGWAAWGRRAALIMVLGMLGACGSQATPAAPAAPTTAPAASERAPAPATPAAAAAATTPPAPVGLRFAYTALSTTIAPYWIAEEAGYFREEGLDLDTRFISASTVGMQSLLAREVDVTTVTGGAALQAAANGADIAIFASNVNAIISQMVTAPEITTPEQLRGQSLGVVRFGTVSDFVAKLLLRGWGLEPGRDVPLVQLGGQAETIGAMQSGGVKAVVVADLPALELRRLGFRLLADGADLGREYVGLGVVANRPYLNTDGEAVRRFVRGLARGMGRFVSDKDYSLQVIQKYTKMEDPEALETSWQAHTEKYANRSLLTTTAAIRTVQEEVADDPRAAGLNPESVIDNRFVQELHDSGFLARVYR